MSFADIRRRIYQPQFGLLKKIGYSTRTSSSNEAISQLVLFFIFCIILTVLIAILLPKETFISAGIPILFFVFGFDMIKELIAAEIEGLEKNLPKHEEISDLKKQISDWQVSSESNLIKEQHLSYLARAYVVDEKISKQFNWINLTLQPYSNDFDNSKEFHEHLEKRFYNNEMRGKLRAVVISIKEKSWIQLATFAARHALCIKKEDINLLKTEPEYFLFLDIYLYLYAWLVSSIDNDFATPTRYMPVKDIGLRYPTEESPDIDAYNKAFYCLIKLFETGDFVNRFSRIQELTEEQKETCKEISVYLTELMIRIKEFNQIPRT